MMKKTTLSLIFTGLIGLCTQAEVPTYSKFKNAVLKSILNPATTPSSSRAFASRLTSTSVYNSGLLQDTAKYFYNNTFASYLETDPIVENLLEGVWKYDSVISLDATLSASSSSKRTYIGTQLSTEIYEDFSSGSRNKTSFSYDGQGRLSQVIFEDEVSAVFVPQFKYKVTYSANGKIDSIIGQQYITAVYIEVYRSKNTYNAANLIATNRSYEFNGASWDLTDQSFYTYNASNKLILTKKYYDQGSGLQIGDSIINAYPSSTIQADTTYSFDNDTVSSGYSQRFVKTAFDKPLFQIYTGSYDAGTKTWFAYSDTTSFLYNGYQQETKQSSGTGMNVYEQNSFYEEYTIASINETSNSYITNVYPNPANSILNIEFANNGSENNLVSLYDLTGKLVKEANFNSTNTIKVDVSNLSLGSYILKVSNNTNSFVKHFTKAN